MDPGFRPPLNNSTSFFHIPSLIYAHHFVTDSRIFVDSIANAAQCIKRNCALCVLAFGTIGGVVLNRAAMHPLKSFQKGHLIEACDTGGSNIIVPQPSAEPINLCLNESTYLSEHKMPSKSQQKVLASATNTVKLMNIFNAACTFNTAAMFIIKTTKQKNHD